MPLVGRSSAPCLSIASSSRTIASTTACGICESSWPLQGRGSRGSSVSLRAKITAAMVGLILTLGLAGTLHARVTLGNELRGELVQRGTTAASGISSRSEDALLTNDVFEMINAAIINDGRDASTGATRPP